MTAPTPDEIARHPIWGIQIIQVDPGTEIDGPDGNKLTVTETNAVRNERAIYMTPKNYTALRALTTPDA